SSTFRPYSAGEAIGDTSPTLPTAPVPYVKKKKGKCGGMGGIIVMVVAVAVSAMTGGIGGVMLGNLAGQLTGNLLGVQKGFDFRSFATAAITAGITQGLGIGGSAGAAGTTISYGKIAADAMITNVVGQAVGNITGAQKGFSWASVAASAVGATAGAYIGSKVGAGLSTTTTNSNGVKTTSLSQTGSFITAVSQGAASSVASQLTQIGLDGKGKMSWANVAVSAVGAGVGAWAGYNDPKDGGKVTPVAQAPSQRPESYWSATASALTDTPIYEQREPLPTNAVTASRYDAVTELVNQTAINLNLSNTTVSTLPSYEAFKLDHPRYTGAVNIGRNLLQGITAPVSGAMTLIGDGKAYLTGQQRSVISGQFYPENSLVKGFQTEGLGYLGTLAKETAIGTVRGPRDLAHGLYHGNADEIGSGGATILGLAGVAVVGRVRGTANSINPTGLRTSAVISSERAEAFLIKNGFSAARAKDYLDSFDGPINARLIRSGEDWSRYTDVANSKGNFLTKAQFSTPDEAVKGLYLLPEFNNNATLVQRVSSTSRSIVLEGAVKNGGNGIKQTLIIDLDKFYFGTGKGY
ncbi:hypothetical protein ACW4YW_15430, partial [Methylobacillus pratensis]